MISFLIAVVKIIILLGFLILIHEAGHFVVAKLCKVKVNEFAIGFGPAIWKKQGKETKYALRLVPLGGFVSMEGEDERSEDDRSFSKASIPKRMLIVVAGATVNIIFAIIVYFALISSSGTYVSNVVDETIDGYAAQQIGLQNGDEIIEIDGEKIRSQKDINEVISNSNGKEVNIKINRNDEILEYNIKPTEVPVKTTGIYLDDEAKIITVEKGSSSEKAGIQANDKLIKVNNIEINQDPNKAVEAINEKGLNTMLLTVERDGQQIQIELTPDYISTYYLGVNLRLAPDTFWNRCINGGMQTADFLTSIVDNLKQLFTGKIPLKNMHGVVLITKMGGDIISTEGIFYGILLTAVISMNLAILNILPIPALDGGHLLFLLIEKIQGKPVDEEISNKIMTVFFSLLILLLVFVLFNDIYVLVKPLFIK